MRIRLLEIELGVKDPTKSGIFYTAVLGLDSSVELEKLKVFNSGVAGVDFNTSTHFPPGTTVVSFLTDSLQTVIDRLSASGIPFAGPRKSHLGMLMIEFTDPDGFWVRVNEPTEESPPWLKV